MKIFETLAPLVLLILLGCGLARIRFLGGQFINDLNKLAFWVVLPSMIFVNASHASAPAGRAVSVWLVLLGATLLICGAGYAAAWLLRLPRASHGTMAQAAFRGNAAFIGLPVMAFSLPAGSPVMPLAVVVMTAMMATYNILAVLVLQGGRGSMREMAFSVATNPLLMAGILGLLWGGLSLPMPTFVDRTLLLLSGAAVPISLLCIGGFLALHPISGRAGAVLVAATLKVGVLPALVFVGATLAGLDSAEMKIALIFSACPTAAASYTMAARMGGDQQIASGAVAASTLFSGPVLALALWLTR